MRFVAFLSFSFLLFIFRFSFCVHLLVAVNLCGSTAARRKKKKASIQKSASLFFFFSLSALLQFSKKSSFVVIAMACFRIVGGEIFFLLVYTFVCTACIELKELFCAHPVPSSQNK